MASGFSRKAVASGRRSSTNDQPEGQRAEQAADCHDRLQHRPGRERLRHGGIQVSLDQPEAAVVDVAGDQRARSDRDHEQLAVHVGNRRRNRRHDPGRRDDGHGRRADRDAQQRGDGPAEHQRGQGHAAHRLRDRGVHAGGVEDPPEPAARAHHEQHAGNRRQRFFSEGKDAVPAESPQGAEGHQRQEGRQQHRHQRRAGELERRPDPAGRQHGLRQRGREHQQDRHQDREQGDRQ